MSYDGPTRYRANAAAEFKQFKRAAGDYARNLARSERKGLREKPLDWSPGHSGYFTAMYQLLGALRALQLQPGARIIEVGSGAGWATEVLASLAYRVTCIEPSREMARVARWRVRRQLSHYGMAKARANIEWIISTLEEAKLPIGAAHAVLFFESFHHVIDERRALARTYAALAPGGYIAILGDANWIPGNLEQETAWDAEMAAYGTLESPFTADYLMWLLAEHGFQDIHRHHVVGGLAAVEREAEPIRTQALLDATFNNIVIARKSGELPAPDLSRPSLVKRLGRALGGVHTA